MDRFATPTLENSVPKELWIEYSEHEGLDFRLTHYTGDPDRRGRAITSYFLNWRFSADGKWHEIEITPEAWIRFRQALKDARCEKLEWQTFDSNTVKAFWTVEIVYPDTTIRASRADVPSLQSDFAPIRKAVRELTKEAIK